MPARARIGISGWTYAPWRGVFYPTGLRQRDELAFAAERMTSIEINGSFYSLHRPSSWESWRDGTPDDFLFSVKAPRYITHMLKLRNARAAVANFLSSGVLALGPKLGPLLWQLPATSRFDEGVLRDFLELLPRTTTEAKSLAEEREARMEGREWLGPVTPGTLRHAIEPRHPSFDDDRFFALLEGAGVACVLADTAGRWPKLDRSTADFAYVRLHGDTVLYESGYDDDALDHWADRCGGWLESGRDVHVYFDNDVKVRAPVDALGLIDRVGR